MLDELTAWHGNPDTQWKDGGTVTASNVQFYQPLLSRQVFHVRLDSKEDAERMKDMELLDNDSNDSSDYGTIEVNPCDNSNV
ncbi:hypothetical protein GGS23DRAFT_597223 [Durotheca rogersii]|uniref:uncharacterized protein n=1 Tax=Durotheca rogersii TaxID=419775 RepID=UPI0022203F97|nr:uncharacterized protein GGS23DRAFT_597223 [Durotheca rogersii]KAI5862918.1 hypothetical protein GGS23DRAFT_597223 [Durotheca rogersii]